MLVDIGNIEFEDRELDQEKVNELRESIKLKGLLNPITVQKVNGSDKFQLVTGLYRLKAIMGISNMIEASVISNVDDISRREIHLHENLKRGHLQWHESVQLVKQLHELRQQQHGASKDGNPHGEKKGWSLRDTAEELGKSLGSTSQDLQLADFVKSNPSLSKVTDKSTAIKLIKQTTTRMRAQEEAILGGDSEFANQIYLGEATAVLSQIPANTFDFCITDPPWFKFAKEDDPSLTRDTFTLPVFQELYRVMKFDSFFQMFIGSDDWFYYKDNLPKMGWKLQGHPCFWEKTNFISRTGVRSWEHGRDFELIMHAVKGNPVMTSSTQISSIYRCPIVPPQKMLHPNEKPLELIAMMLRQISHQGALGIDPFAGSGAHLEAFRKEKRNYVGIERDADRYNSIINRMKGKK